VNDIQLIGFDLDDTLFHATDLAKQARLGGLKNMQKFGLNFEFSKGVDLLFSVVDEFGSNYPYHFNIFLERMRENPTFYDLSPLRFSPAKYVAAGIMGYHHVKITMIQPFPEVPQVLFELKQRGKNLVLISDGIAVKQYEKLIRLDILQYFDNIFISEEVGWEKPNPKFFQHCLNKLGIVPANAVYVGDRLDRDIGPAKNIGMNTILVHRGGKYDPRNLQSESKLHEISFDYEIDDLTELLTIVE
jgi:putative hydrolase of the HAD superfamily